VGLVRPESNDLRIPLPPYYQNFLFVYRILQRGSDGPAFQAHPIDRVDPDFRELIEKKN
jgi:hypothetical protein